MKAKCEIDANAYRKGVKIEDYEELMRRTSHPDATKKRERKTRVQTRA